MHLTKLFSILSILFFAQCKPDKSHDSNTGKNDETVNQVMQIEVTYSAFILKKGETDSFKNKFSPEQLSIILAINRIDENNLFRLDTLIIPDNFEAELIQYSPFPMSLPFLSKVKKIVFFSYFTQSFGVYNSGVLVHWGPTNMGSVKYPTPTGIYYANWKAEETQSTFNDEWILKWNVNLENEEGIGWHQYTMPGYPASHSCLRLLESDAKYLYDWVDEWILIDKENILTRGTPVIIFGTYPFGERKPWKALLNNPHNMDINKETLSKEVTPYFKEISKWELKRDSINSAATSKG